MPFKCPVARKAYKRAHYLKNAAALAVTSATHRATNPDYYRARRLWLKYKMTIPDFDGMLEAQGFRCAICPKTDPGGRNNQWHVDHCHATGKVRGLLCHNCNLALGLVKDNTRTLANMIEYVNHHADLHLLDSGLGRDRRDAGADPDLRSAWLTN